MKTALLLIDRVREKLHTDAAIAHLLDLSPQNFQGMKKGRRHMQPYHVAKLCDALQLPGEEARELAARIATEQEADPEKASVMKRALFACWVLGVGTLLQAPPDANGMALSDAKAGTNAQSVRSNGLYIVAHGTWCRGLAAAARWWRTFSRCARHHDTYQGSGRPCWS